MDRRPRLATLPALPLLFALAATAGAETLLVERVQAEPAAVLPARGLSMAQVQARFGEPRPPAWIPAAARRRSGP